MASVCPSAKSEAEYEHGIDLVDILVRRAVGLTGTPEGIHEIFCRLYGGWFAHDGTPTRQRIWLLRNLKRFGGLRNGIWINAGRLRRLADPRADRLTSAG